MRNIN